MQPGITPAAVDAEAALIGACLVDSRVLGGLDLTPQEFFNPCHVSVWEAFQHLHQRRHPIEPVSVADQLSAQGDASRFAHTDGGAPVYLMRLATESPVTAITNSRFYAGKIRSAFQLRKLLRLSADLQSRCYADGADATAIIGDVRREIAEVELSGDNVGPVRIGDRIVDVLGDVFDRAQNPSAHCVQTGIEAFDLDIGGLRPERMIVVAARPGIGKTAFAGTIARNAAKAGIPALVFSLEMSFAEMAERMIGAEAQVDVDHLGRGLVTPEEARRLHSGCLRKLTDAPLYVDDRGQTMARIASVARIWKAQQRPGLALIVIDYLGLIKAVKAESRSREIGEMAFAAKMLSKELKIPIIMVSQLNRAIEDGSPPELKNLRDSGEIEQHADQVIFPHRTGNLAESGHADIVVAKNRGGRIGIVPCRWVGEYTTFIDGSTDGRFE